MIAPTPIALRAAARTFALLCLPLSSALAQGGVILPPPAPCPDNGSCHLSRWVPENAFPAQSMGESVAIADDLAVVGLPCSDRIEIWSRRTNVWQREQTLVNPGGAGDRFGASVAIHDSLIWVGAPLNDDQATDAGAVYVFGPDATGAWSIRRTMHSNLPETGGRFGSAVAVTGGWLAIGEPTASLGGRVTTYHRVTGTAMFTEILTVPGTQNFGQSLAIHFNDLAIGDPLNSAGGAFAGIVYVARLSLVSPTVLSTVTSGMTQPGDGFGTDVAIGAEGLFVGAPGHDQPVADSGTVYRFELQNGPGFAFTERESFSPCLASTGMHFGRSMELDNRTLVVGAPTGEAAFVFENTGILGIDNWQLEDRLRAADNIGGDSFGSAVALSGSTVLVGAPEADASAVDSGAAYLFSRDSVLTGLVQCPSDILWSVERFGPGKAGAAGIPTLQNVRPLTPGVNTTIGVSNLTPGTQPLLIYGFSETAIPFDGGIFHIADPIVIPLPTVTVLGRVGSSLSIPPSLGLAGAQLLAQVLVIDPGAAGPFGTAQSRGHRLTIGF